MNRIVFVFLDGVGLGPAGAHNPLSEVGPGLRRLAGGQFWTRPLTEDASLSRRVKAIDATLGVEGLPQSGTGQGALLTGKNCAETVGRHFGPFPHSATHEALDQRNLFNQLRALRGGMSSAFANAFPPRFFDTERRWETVTTRCCRAAGVPLRGLEALQAGRALTADLTGAFWRDHLGLAAPTLNEAEAAATLASLSRDHALTFFEYFLTDKVGHQRINTPAVDLLSQVDRFLDALQDALDPACETLIVTSDHGNLEDTRHTQHTRNPVPLLVQGWAAPHFTDVRSLTDIMPSIVAALRASEDPPPSPL